MRERLEDLIDIHELKSDRCLLHHSRPSPFGSAELSRTRRSTATISRNHCLVGFAKKPPQRPPGRNVVLDRAHRRDLSPIADAKMIVDPHLGPQRHIVANRQAAREPDLGRQQAMPADGHIVADLDLIVDFGAFADHGVAQAAAIDGRSGADLHVVLDQYPAGLRHFQMAVRSEEDEAIAVLSDAAAGMDQDVVADKRELNGAARADVAIPADPDIGADHRARTDDRAGADFDVRARSRPADRRSRRLPDARWDR